ncbi:MAG TPA: rod shape-determining protein MreC [Nitrospirae bacterium]|nr:rod shape-determining protein MreC [Nitrospirota bacterium]
MRNRRVVLLFLVVVVSASLMTFQSTRGPFKPLTVLQTPLYRLERGFAAVMKIIKSPFLYYFRLENENRMLKSKIGQLKMKGQEYTELKFENRRLSTILGIKETTPHFIAAARVISSGIRQWPELIIIDKGTSSGIKKDMAVRTPEGLVGKTSEVMQEFSKVLLVTDVSFSVSVRLQDTRIEGILSGSGNGSCILKYIPRDEYIKPGALLITSGLDGVFPKGIPVGYITGVAKGSELFLDVKVKPIIKASMIEEVMVFKK